MAVVQQSKKMADLVKTMGGTMHGHIHACFHMLHSFSLMLVDGYWAGMKGLWKSGDLSRNVNANQMAQLRGQLAKTMDPAVLHQMGGMQGLDKMIKQLHASGGNIPGL